MAKRGSRKVSDYPEVARQWHPVRNGDLRPEDISHGSKRLVWWKCDVADDHEWEASPQRRITSGAGCRCCTGYQASVTNSLADRYPLHARFWHPTRNDGVKSENVVAESEKKYWWSCFEAPDHEWHESPAKVIRRKTPCPFCGGRRVCGSNSLATLFLEVAAEWHPTKNGELRPDQVRPGSGKRVWWRCDVADDHVWRASPSDRTGRGTGCPACTGRQASVTNSLATVDPDLAAQWHPTRNKLTPEEVTAKSSKKVWWRCPVADDHEWPATVANRSAGSGCPCCSGQRPSKTNSLLHAYPEVAAQWHVERNGERDLAQVVGGSSERVWWRCLEDPIHEWRTTVRQRTQRGTGCPACSGKMVTPATSLRACAPHLVVEWDKDKNEITPDDVTRGSNRVVWWRCKKGPDHVWDAPVVARAVAGGGCPFCRGLRVSVTNSLVTLHPEVAAEWHPTKNGDLTPADITASSSKQVWWLCPVADDHVWPAPPNNRTSSWHASGCPCCAGIRLAKDNSLAACFPDVAAEWDEERNDPSTPDLVLAGSHDHAWWVCNEGPDHRWRASIHSRTSAGRGCPFCDGKQVSVTNRLSAVAPDVAERWHPARNGQLTPNDVVAGADRRVWWKCPEGPDHEWQATVKAVAAAPGSGCPFCRGLQASVTNSIASMMPKLAEEWHPTKNGELRPDGVVIGSNKRIWWRCRRYPKHEWPARVYHRAVNGSGCPTCHPPHAHSLPEVILAFELGTVFSGVDPDRHEVEVPNNPRPWNVDVVLEVEGYRVAIEYDGHHWHSSPDAKERDQVKTASLEAAGWTVIRAREEPLEPLGPHDVVVSPRKWKEMVDAVMGALVTATGAKRRGARTYLRRSGLRKEAAAKRYYESIRPAGEE